MKYEQHNCFFQFGYPERKWVLGGYGSTEGQTLARHVQKERIIQYKPRATVLFFFSKKSFSGSTQIFKNEIMIWLNKLCLWNEFRTRPSQFETSVLYTSYTVLTQNWTINQRVVFLGQGFTNPFSRGADETLWDIWCMLPLSLCKA